MGLQEARRLMLSENLDAASAALPFAQSINLLCCPAIEVNASRTTDQYPANLGLSLNLTPQPPLRV